MTLLADSCNIINLNSQFRSKFTIVRNSKLILSCLKKIYDLGFISGFEIIDKKKIKVFLKFNDFEATLRNISIISVPSKDYFLKKTKIQNMSAKNFNGFIIISTNIGLLTDIECICSNKGGLALI